ncbi:aspartyl protease family protein [Flavilitoribacter nigricans]|uniref:Peptidase A2 domain-containing protein n=1 Tax=Flavilitoribacter nigricans (strain ATCC 23147 / DSM 23189 / NBRC 102662 / NCIMB 1420 / SS-2) TaxID=1122177 RepID=A0A2D0NJ84_FLAN2|nr:aspartyl protease family protein [Flavilitoribacter nigricans]PHN08259.1 hypothetical protein CRP01_02750 [Flavilitoribacter nigricans DSM 23189 = NBRC 102662]
MTTRYIISSLLMVSMIFTASASIKSIPFKLVRGVMVIHATVDGQTGNFILDSGVPGVVLNARYFTGKKSYAINCSGFQFIGGISEECQGRVIRMSLGEVSYRGYAAVVDLQPVEKAKRMNILGMVGFKAFKKYEVVFDFHLEEIQLYELDQKGNRTSPEHYVLPDATLNLRFLEHLPYISARIGSREIRLGLDTGAEVNILSEEIYEDNGKLVDNIRSKRIVTMGGTLETLICGNVRSLRINGQLLPEMQTIFMSLDQLNKLSGPDLDGLIGPEFLKHFRTAFNFKRKEIYFWKGDDRLRAARN